MLKRWRNRHGFGVHSPFAFRFITEVMPETCSYYAYAHLPDADSRLLLRIACALCPGRISSIGGASDKVARKACQGSKAPAPKWIGVDSTSLTVAGQHASSADIKRCIEGGDALFVTSAAQQQQHYALQELAALGHGMAFLPKDGPAIVFPFDHLSYQVFKL